MSENDNPAEFGPFGDVKPVGTRRKRRFPFFKVLMIACLLVGLPAAIHGWNEFYDNLAEQDPPTIKWLKPPSGVGQEPVELRILVSDRQSGLDEVIVRSEQGTTTTLLNKSYPTKLNEDTVVVPLNAKQIGLREGQARIDITVFDRSFWSSSTKSSLELVVDYKPPTIEVLSTQHNAVRTGVELVFYRLSSDPGAFSGVTVGSALFPGFQAKQLDPDYEKTPDVFFAFFSIPRGFDSEKDKLMVIAKDAVGNFATGSLFYRVKELGNSAKKVAVSNSFMETRVDELYKSYLEMQTKVRGTGGSEFVPSIRPEEEIERFKLLNGPYRQLVEEVTKSIFQRPKVKRFWQGKFGYPGGRRVSGASGELQQYYLGDTHLGDYRNEGVYFAIPAGGEVRAANDGVVIYADLLGTYGRTIILDHGFGLTSLYGHLSSINQVEGDRVSTGEIIAQAGSTGFIEGEKTVFEMRLHGVPIRLEEWWDESWIRDHVWSKVNAIKRKLDLQVRTVLE